MHMNAFWQEIKYYRLRNAHLREEDVLRRESGLKPIHKEEIKRNEERMNKLWEDMILHG